MEKIFFQKLINPRVIYLSSESIGTFEKSANVICGVYCDFGGDSKGLLFRLTTSTFTT
jgi:hypothetical protein